PASVPGTVLALMRETDQAAFLAGFTTVACMSITRPTMLLRSMPSLASSLLIMLRPLTTPIAVVFLSLAVFCIESTWRSAAAALSLLALVCADALMMLVEDAMLDFAS